MTTAPIERAVPSEEVGDAERGAAEHAECEDPGEGQPGCGSGRQRHPVGEAGDGQQQCQLGQ